MPVPGAVCQESCWAGATRRPATQLSRHPTSTNCHTLLYVTRLTIERTVHQSVQYHPAGQRRGASELASVSEKRFSFLLRSLLDLDFPVLGFLTLHAGVFPVVDLMRPGSQAHSLIPSWGEPPPPLPRPMDSIRKQVCTLVAIALVLLVANLVIWDSIFRTPVPVLYARPAGVAASAATTGAAVAVAAAAAAEPGLTTVTHAAASWGHSPAPSVIPLVLWQTYKTRDLPEPAQDAAASWTDLNRDLASRFYSDAEAADFMSRTLGAEMLAIYHSFPLGVMRADFFRYAMLLDQGGIYADVDTACKVGGSHDWGCL